MDAKYLYSVQSRLAIVIRIAVSFDIGSWELHPLEREMGRAMAAATSCATRGGTVPRHQNRSAHNTALHSIRIAGRMSNLLLRF